MEGNSIHKNQAQVDSKKMIQDYIKECKTGELMEGASDITVTNVIDRGSSIYVEYHYCAISWTGKHEGKVDRFFRKENFNLFPIMMWVFSRGING